MRWNYLIADDEPIAREIIQRYCDHVPDLQLVASCGSALEARNILKEQKVDILFLDINMPVLDGISFMRTMKNPPQVIFTTAYKEFAVDAFDLAACDYLLKPFSLDRFLVAVDKATQQLKGFPAARPAEQNTANTDEVFIRTDGKIFKINLPDLLYAEANGNYTKLVGAVQTIMPTMTFSAVEALLPADQFLRIHRSFIINKSKISHIEGNRVYIGTIEIPIGNNYKEGLLRTLGL